MAKIQITIRIEGGLLDAIDEIAELQGETRTDVIAGILERGIGDEQAFADLSKIPGLQLLVDGLVKSGFAAVVGKLTAKGLDERRMRLLDQAANKRRGARARVRLKGASSGVE